MESALDEALMAALSDASRRLLRSRKAAEGELLGTRERGNQPLHVCRWCGAPRAAPANEQWVARRARPLRCLAHVAALTSSGGFRSLAQT